MIISGNRMNNYCTFQKTLQYAFWISHNNNKITDEGIKNLTNIIDLNLHFNSQITD